MFFFFKVSHCNMEIFLLRSILYLSTPTSFVPYIWFQPFNRLCLLDTGNAEFEILRIAPMSYLREIIWRLFTSN